MIEGHRNCGERVCRRARRCVGRDLRCNRETPMPELTPERQARILGDVQQAMKRRVADIKAKEGARVAKA